MRVQGESVLVKRPVGSIILARGHPGHGLRRRIPIMARKSVKQDPSKLRSRQWFANPDNPNMTAL